MSRAFPPKDELIAAIQKRINEKFRLRIQQRKASVYILDGGCDKTGLIEENLQTAIQELGVDVNVEKISDPETIASYGVAPSQTPAIVMAKYQVKALRRTPEVVVIKEWLQGHIKKKTMTPINVYILTGFVGAG